MWGYDKINESYRLCKRCGAVVGNVEVHDRFHTHFIGDDTPIYELGLPVRVDNSLRQYGILTVEALIGEIKEESRIWKGGAMSWLMDLRNVGFRTAEKALGVMQQRGLLDTSGHLIED